jgi:hypothetical protein
MWRVRYRSERGVWVLCVVGFATFEHASLYAEKLFVGSETPYMISQDIDHY